MRQTEIKLSQFRVPAQLRRCWCKRTWAEMLAAVVWLLGRVAVLYLHSTHHKVAHFIPKVHGAVGRKQELLEKCIQGKSVPFLRKGMARAWGNCLAGRRRRHWSGTQTFTHSRSCVILQVFGCSRVVFIDRHQATSSAFFLCFIWRSH